MSTKLGQTVHGQKCNVYGRPTGAGDLTLFPASVPGKVWIGLSDRRLEVSLTDLSAAVAAMNPATSPNAAPPNVPEA